MRPRHRHLVVVPGRLGTDRRHPVEAARSTPPAPRAGPGSRPGTRADHRRTRRGRGGRADRVGTRAGRRTPISSRFADRMPNATLSPGLSCSPCSSRGPPCSCGAGSESAGRGATTPRPRPGRAPVGAQLLVEVGVVGDGPQQVADEVTGGLVPRDEEEHELGARLDVGEAAPVDLALQQPGDEVVARVVTPRGDQARRRSRRTRGARPGRPTPRSLRFVAGQVPCTTSSDHAAQQRGSRRAVRRAGAR